MNTEGSPGASTAELSAPTMEQAAAPVAPDIAETIPVLNAALPETAGTTGPANEALSKFAAAANGPEPETAVSQADFKNLTTEVAAPNTGENATPLQATAEAPTPTEPSAEAPEAAQAQTTKGNRLSELRKQADAGTLDPKDKATYQEFHDLQQQEKAYKDMDAQFKSGELDPAKLDEYNQMKDQFGEITPETPEQKAEQERSTQEQFNEINNDDDKTIDRMSKGEINRQEARKIILENRARRKKLVDALVERLDTGDRTLTKFEKEVAEAGAKVRQTAYQLMYAPLVVDNLEKQLQVAGKKFDDVEAVKVDKNDVGASEQNLKLREQYGNEIAFISTEIARYSVIAKSSYNEFMAANNQLDSLVGQRNGFKTLVVAAYTGTVRRLQRLAEDPIARRVARSRKA